MSDFQLKQLRSLLDKGKSIPVHILEGSIKIASPEVFEFFFKHFPKDPALHRAYADILQEKNSREEAAKNYDVAAKLYFEGGFLLQAIVAKLLQWRLQTPAKDEKERFFKKVRQSSQQGLPVKAFLDNLPVREINIVFSAMELIRLQGGRVISNVGDPEETLFFVVYGTLVDSTYWSLNQHEKSNRNDIFCLTEDDFWGEIYPFEEDHHSQSQIETLTRSELLRLDKTNLIRICKRYPNVERGLLDLFKIRAQFGPDNFSKRLRRAGRHRLPIMVKVKIDANGSINRPLFFKGYSRDISVGGIGVVLEAKKLNVSYSLGACHHTLRGAAVRVAFDDEALALQVSGKVVWSDEALFEGQKTLVLGIQFTDMSAKLRGVLFAFANGLERRILTPSS
jgi:adenylate kinase family enzyme